MWAMRISPLFCASAGDSAVATSAASARRRIGFIDMLSPGSLKSRRLFSARPVPVGEPVRKLLISKAYRSGASGKPEAGIDRKPDKTTGQRVSGRWSVAGDELGVARQLLVQRRARDLQQLGGRDPVAAGAGQRGGDRLALQLGL